MRREQQLVKNTMLLSIGVMLPRLVMVIALPIYTGALSSAEYGSYNLITTLASMLAPALTIQIQTAAFRFLISEREEKDIKNVVSNVIFFVAPISVVTLIVMYFCLGSFSPQVRILVSVYIFLEMYYGVTQQLLRGMGKNMEFSFGAIINTVCNVAIVIPLLLWVRMGLEGMLVALCAANIVSTLYMALKARMFSYLDIKLVDRLQIKKMLKYSWPMVPNNASMWVLTASDQLIITAVLGPASNGVYSAATKLPQILTYAQNTFTLAWQESASVSIADKDSTEYYNVIFDGLLRVITGLMGLLIGFMPILFAILIRGDSFSAAYVQMPILLWAMLFFGLSSYYGGIYVAEMKVGNVALTTVVAAVINLIINFIFIGKIGIFAASGSTLISYVFMTIFRAVDTRNMRKIRYNWKNIVLFAAVLLIMSALFYSGNTPLKIVNGIVGVVFCLAINKDLILPLCRMIFGKFGGRKV